MKARHTGAFLVILLIAACQPAILLPTSSPFPTSQPSSTPQPSATATLPDLTWPTYQAATLAPFPLTSAQLEATPLAETNGAIRANQPVALSEHDHFYFSRPVRTSDLRYLVPSSRYGAVQTGTEQDAHLGIDFSVNSGTPVLAAAAGTVIWADYGLLYNSVNYLDDPYGISVVIRHDFGYDGERLFTLYAHLSEAKVEPGDRVERGELIALSGNTGLSTGPHLHFEVRVGENTIYYTRNPELWLSPPEGGGTIAGRVTTTTGFLVMSRLVEVRSMETGQRWIGYTYATDYTLHPDGYYAENFALSDLPEGRYEISIPYLAVWRRVEVEVRAGAVTYFQFRGLDGFLFELPAESALGYLPE
jgi:hypothetical protein